MAVRSLAVGVACAALLASACGSSPPGAPASASAVATASGTPEAATSGTRHVVAGPLGIDVPEAWHVRPGELNPSGNVTFAYLSPIQLPGECQDTAQGGVCRPWPLLQLPPGGIVLAVRLHGMPGSEPPAGGDPMTVGGFSARRVSGPADAGCRAIGGSQLTEVVLPSLPGTAGWMSLDACQAGGGGSPADAALSAILASVAMTGDAASP